MSNYTPSPWVIDNENDGINYKGGIMQNFECAIKSSPDLDGNEWFIALIHQGAGMNELEGEEETLANARLISAAPELLEALQEVVKISDRKHDAWDKAKDAIAKALGT